MRISDAQPSADIGQRDDYRCVHDLIEAEARLRPAAIAVLCGDRHVSYRCLDDMASRVAARLTALGVGPEVLVGLCGRRSPELIAGLIGILKAGGGYVCLDPGHPLDRIETIVQNSALRLVLIDDVGEARWLDGLHRITLADAVRADGTPARQVVRAAATPQNVATVIYTSGSAGRPKGVVLSHQAIVTRLLEWKRRFAHGPRCQRSSFGLVAHMADLLQTLVIGEPVLLLDDETVRNPIELARMVRRHGISTFGLVPSQLQALLESDAAVQHVSHVTRVFVGGEVLAPSLAARFESRMPQASLLNAYGLSETVGSVTSGGASDGARVCVGRPSSNLSVYLLDDDFEIVAPGAAGEVCVGGTQLSRGYRGRPDLTAEAFVPDPFSAQPGARLFRTGDIGRYLNDGSLALLGRRDDEVKVRGHRVNIPDIEGVFGEIPGIDRAAVVLQTSNGEHGRLAAFVLRSAGIDPPISWTAIRSHLRERLPEYMVPFSFEAVDELPLLPGGKIDRRRLSARAKARVAVGTGHDEPSRASTQEVLTGIWSEVFETPVETPDADFFDIGGESLIAMRVLGRVASRWGVELSLEDIFENPTVTALASAIERRLRDGQQPVTKARHA